MRETTNDDDDMLLLSSLIAFFDGWEREKMSTMSSNSTRETRRKHLLTFSHKERKKGL